jgi:hypothetical protein
MADRRDGLLVKIGGKGFSTNPEGIDWQTVNVGRQSVDQGAGPGESALSNEVIWRRSRDDGIEGAGQEFADLLNNESSILRFNASFGINPWTRRQFSLLNTTHSALISTNTNLKMVTATQSGTPYVFLIDGSTLKRCANPYAATPTWTTLTGGAGPYTDITTDGTRVWVCDGSNVYKVDSGTALSSFSTADTNVLGYSSGRLLGAAGNSLFELDSTGTQIPVFTHPSALFLWDGLCHAPNGIYFWGHCGDNSEVYTVTAVEASGALDIPVSACALPDGELLNIMCFYLGAFILGTSLGVRLGVLSGGGFLSFGPVITQPGSVRCLEPQGDDVWFGTNGFPGVAGLGPYAGLGRIHLDRFTANLVPAFAQDISSALTGTPTSVITFSNKRMFAISGHGIYAQSDTFENHGILDLGWFTFGIPEPKMIDSLSIWTDALPPGTAIEVQVFPDDEVNADVIQGTYDTDGARTATFQASLQTAAERYHVYIHLTADSLNTLTPVLRRTTLRVVPRPFVPQQIIVPIILNDNVHDEQGVDYGLDVFDDWTYLSNLVETQARTTLQLGSFSAPVRLDSLQVPASGPYTAKWIDGWDDRKKFLAGKWLLTCVTVEPATA